jgi:hypothetical protein
MHFCVFSQRLKVTPMQISKALSWHSSSSLEVSLNYSVSSQFTKIAHSACYYYPFTKVWKVLSGRNLGWRWRVMGCLFSMSKSGCSVCAIWFSTSLQWTNEVGTSYIVVARNRSFSTSGCLFCFVSSANRSSNDTHGMCVSYTTGWG